MRPAYRFTTQDGERGRERLRISRDESFQDRLEDVLELLDAGESPIQVASRLGTTVGALAAQMYRRGQSDLGRVFAREEKRQRMAS